jgi:hypothetical protein
MPDEEGESEDEDIGVQGKDGLKTKPPKIEQKEEKKVYATVPRQKTSKGDYIVTGFVIPDKKAVIREEKEVYLLLTITNYCRIKESILTDKCSWLTTKTKNRLKSKWRKRKRLQRKSRLKPQPRPSQLLAPRSRNSRRIRRRWMS